MSSKSIKSNEQKTIQAEKEDRPFVEGNSEKMTPSKSNRSDKGAAGVNSVEETTAGNSDRISVTANSGSLDLLEIPEFLKRT